MTKSTLGYMPDTPYKYEKDLLTKCKKLESFKNYTYPEWICTECAQSNGGHTQEGHISTYHINSCGWCEKEKSVTSPRNLGWPEYKREKK